MKKRFGAMVVVSVTFSTAAISAVLDFQLQRQSTQAVSNEWTQHAHDAQRTGYTPEDPLEPWTFKWHWKPVGSTNDTMPVAGHPVTGGGNVYVPGGIHGLYALDIANGTVRWTCTAAEFHAAPAYDPVSGYLYAGATNGRLYKINITNGNVIASYNAGNPIRREVLLVGGYAYIVTDNGTLAKVDTSNMSQVWTYSAGSPGQTCASYSPSRDCLIFCTQDLHVHAVNNSNGLRKWRKKPTALNYDPCKTYSFEYGWPVVAETPGVVLVRMRLDRGNSWWDPKTATTNSAIKADLESNPARRPLFALSLDTGDNAFTPAVGGGGVDDYCRCGVQDTCATMGPQPCVKTLSTGKQVAYTPWRNGDTADPSWDFRWDAHMGEMVLDNSTVPGYTAGDVRFVYFDGTCLTDGMITDELCFMSVAGNVIFHAHWGASEAARILDRSDSRGLTRSNPITTRKIPYILRRFDGAKVGATRNDVTRWANTSWLALACETRAWPGEGTSGIWWMYWGEPDEPYLSCGSIMGGYGSDKLRRYTFVSAGHVIVVGNAGDLFVLKHSGTVVP